MKKILYILAVFLLPVVNCLTLSQSLNPEQIYKNTENSILYVLSYNEEGNMICQGSAVAINDEGLIYTCFHVYDESERIEFELNGKKYTDAVIAGADPEKDIIIFKVKDLVTPGIKTANSDSIYTGEIVYALGNPQGYKKTFSAGIVSSIRNEEMGIGKKQIQYTASTSHGSSGGALLNSRGELIGIAASLVENGQNMNFAIPVNDFLRTILIDTEDTIQVNAMADFCQGYSCYQNDRFFLANQLFNSSLEYFRNNINALSFSGNNYCKRGMYDSAIARFNDIISIHHENKKAFYDRGWSFYCMDDTLAALSDFNKALEIDSNYIEALMGRAYVYHYLSNNFDSAINDYNRLFVLKPDYLFLLKYRGEAYLAKGDTGKAITDLKSSVNHDIDNAFTCFSRGQLFSELEYFDEAIYDFSRAITLEPYNFNYYFSRGIAYTKLFDYINAINDYNEGLKLHSNNASMLNNLAYSHLMLNEYEDAERNFKRALLIDDNHFDSMLGLSILNFKQNERKACIKYIKQAGEIEPLIKKGMKGLIKLENRGYFWSLAEKKVLNDIFRLAGYYSYENDEIETKRADRPVSAES